MDWAEDELSELAEALEAACDEAEQLGYKITPFHNYWPKNKNYCCPFGALLVLEKTTTTLCDRYPAAMQASVRLQIPWEVVLGFIAGFENENSSISMFNSKYTLFCSAKEMGKIFRYKYLNS